MTTTPPPASRIRTPPSPLHGAKHDSYYPYTTRRSFRSSIRETTTPPPPSSFSEKEARFLTTPPSKRRMAAHNAKSALSPPPSKQSSPNTRASSKKARVNQDLLDRGQGSDDELSAPNASTLAPPMPKKNGLASVSAGMLPTPAKTPRKRPGQPDADFKTTARVLFQDRLQNDEDAMPSPKKKSRKRTGLSLGGFAGETGEKEDARIQIFTDSKERVPELDATAENPFYNKSGDVQHQQPSRENSSKKRKARKNKSEVDEMVKRDDGMVYVFRGKKIFRKFDHSDDEFSEDDDLDGPSSDALQTEAIDGRSSRHRPMTRSSIKPRLLFPTEDQKRTRTRKVLQPEPVIETLKYDEEEAPTDIDELATGQPYHSFDNTDTAMDDPAKLPLPVSPITPLDDHLISSSPPSATRSTRGSAKRTAADNSSLSAEADEFALPVPKKGKKTSPFDRWQRTKAGTGTKGKKREGDEIERSGGVVSKRTRSGPT